MKLFLPFIASLMIILFAACGEDSSTDECTGVVATYNTVVKPILDQSCANQNCHDSKTKADGVDFSTYISTKDYLSVAGNKFVCSIGNSCNPILTGHSRLADSDVKILTCWYNNGFPEN